MDPRDPKSFPFIPVAGSSGTCNTNTQFAQVAGDTAAPSIDKELKPRKKGLTGAARRRIAWWMDRGKTFEEAREMCLLPLELFEEYMELKAKTPDIPKRPTKRSYADQGSLSEATPQKVANLNKATTTYTYMVTQTDEMNNDRSTTSQSSVRVGIFDVAGGMSADQCTALQSSILQLLEEEPLDGNGPKFLGSTRRCGGLVLICANETTKQWLHQVIPNIVPWERAKLRVLDENQMPKPRIAYTYIPDSDITEERFLRRLAVQNEGIDFANWRVINKKAETTGKTLTLSLDESSCESLARCCYRLYYGLGNIGIRMKPLKNHKGKHDSEWAADEVETPTFETDSPKHATTSSPPRETNYTSRENRATGKPQILARNSLPLGPAEVGSYRSQSRPLRHVHGRVAPRERGSRVKKY